MRAKSAKRNIKSIHHWLVVFIILKHMKVNGKDDIPYMKWKIKAMFETTIQNSFPKSLKILMFNCYAQADSSRSIAAVVKLPQIQWIVHDPFTELALSPKIEVFGDGLSPLSPKKNRYETSKKHHF